MCAVVLRSHVIEPLYPGAADHYLDLSGNYDRAALAAVRGEIVACMKGYRDCYRRAYRCLSAAAEVGDDMRAILLTPALEEKMAKRARGILSREARPRGGTGVLKRRFLGGITCEGVQCLFDTAEAQCRRIYELQDNYALGHILLNHLLAGVLAAGYDAVACPNPLVPELLEHLLVPELSLAFVTSTQSLPYPGESYRRLRIDAMTDPELQRRSRARLRFSKKVAAALTEEAVVSLKQAKEAHDKLEEIYNPHVNFARLYETADRLADELLAGD